MLVDQNTEGVVVPLNAELDSEGKLELANSMSSLGDLFRELILVYSRLSERDGCSGRE